MVMLAIFYLFFQSYADEAFVAIDSCRDENDDGNMCMKRNAGLGHRREEEGKEVGVCVENVTPFSMPIDYAVCEASFTIDESIKIRGKRDSSEEKGKNKAVTSARIVLREASDERCDWRVRPLAFIRGEICGSYYKVLRVDRNEPMDKDRLNQAFVTMTEAVEAENLAIEDTTDAYSYLHVAFNCISDDVCRKEYDKKLDVQAFAIAQGRRQLREDVQEFALHVARKTYSGITIGSGILYGWGMDLWAFANQWQMEVPEIGVIPVGKFMVTSILFMKGQILLKLHGLTWLVVRINQEIHSLVIDAINGVK